MINIFYLKSCIKKQFNKIKAVFLAKGQSDVNLNYRRAKKIIFFKKRKALWSRFLLLLFVSAVPFAGYYVGKTFLLDSGIKISDLSTIVGVLAAGIVSLIVSENNKENEINKHKEKWCSEVRDYYGYFYAAVHELSKKAFEGVDDESGPPRNRLIKIGDNLRSCDEEKKNITRYTHIMSLYLLSENRSDPKQNVYEATRDLRRELNKVIDRVLKAADEIKKKDGVLIPFNERKCEYEIEFLKSKIESETAFLSYKVKVYLDYEWGKLNRWRIDDNKKRIFLYSLLLFLICGFISFIWNKEI